VEWVELSGGATALEVGQTAQFVARAYDGSGREIGGRTAVWQSTRDTVASVMAGLVTARTAGSTRIAATVDGVTASAELAVTDIPVARVQINRDSVMLRTGYTTPVTAQAFAASGAPIPGRRVTWRTTNQAIFLPRSTGPGTAALSGSVLGSALLIATADSAADTLSVTVYLARAARVAIDPQYVQLEAEGTIRTRRVAFDAAGDTVHFASFSHSSQSPDVATFDFGDVRARGTGTTRVVARVDAAADTATVVVLGTRSILTSAWARGDAVARVRAGDTVSVPVSIDLSRVGATGDLGALQAELAYPTALLAFDAVRAEPGSSVQVNAVQPGVLRIAYASPQPRAEPRVIVATLTFRVTGAAGARGSLRLVHTLAPRTAGFQAYDGLIVPEGRIFIVP
jgi:hypothetical protein